jgi:DNA-binding SARP family transcriptional activator/tetratricopeptide (TPR) repeat protein
MRYQILGPLHVADAAVTAARDRVLLAMLLLRPGVTVPIGHLMDAIWPDGPPATAKGQLHSAVSRLRRALPAESIVSDPAGYGIRVTAADLDLLAFDELTAAPRTVERLRAARALWRGPALDGMDSPAIRHLAAGLDERRAVVVEDWVDLELAAGRHRDLLGELTALVHLYPLRERLRGQLVLALHRAGRRADALAEYRRARDLLHDDLGIEPGAGLQAVHRQVLTGSASVPPVPPVPPVTPVRCLPRAVGDFTGRDAVVARLAAAGSGILVIDGMAGSGKTALAVHVATLIGDRYPDAHLFIDLHGHSDRDPVRPAAALLTLLRQLGVPAERIPADVDERAALWRTELTTRRAVIVLDNAASSTQVAPLIPAAPDVVVLVTSRRRLSGLDGVRPESLPVLAEAEAVELLRRIAGQRVAAEPAAALEVVRRCGCLPLAIRLAGARLAHRSRWRVSDLLRRLSEAALPELAAEDRTVAAAFALSYEHVPERARGVFRLLGLHPGEQFDVLSVAALTDLPVTDAEDIVDILVDAHLLDEPEPGLFRLHDLLREFAATLAGADDTDRVEPVRRLLDFQLHVTAGAVVERGDHMLSSHLGARRPRRPDLVAAAGTGWDRLERDRSDLARFVTAALASGLVDFAWLLPRSAWFFLWTRGYHEDIKLSHGRGLTFAREVGDDLAAGIMLNYLASAEARTGDTDRAIAHCEEALAIHLAQGDPGFAAQIQSNLATLHEGCGQPQRSIDLARAAIVVLNRRGRDAVVSSPLGSIGASLVVQGHLDEALRMHRRQLLLAIQTGRELRVANALLYIAACRRRMGHPPRVVERRLQAALRMFRRVANTAGEAQALNEIGATRRAAGRTAEAIAHHEAALALIIGIGDRRWEAVIRNDLGRGLEDAGDHRAAARSYRTALQIAVASKISFEEGRALHALGRLDPADAEDHWRRALAIFERIGAPERHDVAAELDHLHDGGGRGTMEA